MTTANNETTETRTMRASEAGLMVAYLTGKEDCLTCPTITNGRTGWSLSVWDEAWKNHRTNLTADASRAAEWVQIYASAIDDDRVRIEVTMVVDVTATPSQHDNWNNQPYGKPCLYWP